MVDFEAGDYTGPVGPSREDREKWYHRFKDFCHAIQQRKFGIVAHPDDKGLIKDSLERLPEDESWPHGSEVPPVFFTKRVKPGNIMPCDHETMQILTMAAVTRSQKGFGRFAGLYTPGRDGLSNPWRKPKESKLIRTDKQRYSG